MKPTVHLVGPGPHSETTLAWTPDAYSAKTRRLGGMLTGKGYRVVLYGGSRNESDVAQFVPLVSAEERERWFPGYSPHLEVWNNYDTASAPWQTFNGRAVAEIRKRAQKGDILGLTMGQAHQPIAMALADMGLYTVETGIGYSGVFAPFRVFESRAWETYLAGRDGLDHRQFDVVIPNSYDPAEFPAGTGSGGYHLYASRFIGRKGLQVAVQATAALGVELVMIGPDLLERNGNVYRGRDSTVEGAHIRHLGPVGPADRARIMGDAVAIWAPTLYYEPFGGVVVEAMMCGTPAITSDAGSFTEIVVQCLNGFRCRVLSDFIAAGRRVADLDRAVIREDAVRRYSTEVAAGFYDRYFTQLTRLAGKGWGEEADLDEEVERGAAIGRLGDDVQPGDGEAGGAGDAGGEAAAGVPVRSAPGVGRGSPRPRARRVGLPPAEHPDGRAVPTLRAVGD